MTLCIPFLMFQGQAQEAIDHYLDVFPDAELLEIVHHPAGTEIYDPTPRPSAEPVDPADTEVPEDSDGGKGSDAVKETEPTQPESTEAEQTEAESTDTTLITVKHAQDASDHEEVITVPVPLVATAQLRIGGQVLMIQDSLMKHQFSFTPSISVAVVVDSAAEFHQIVDSLAPGGEFLMEPDDYDFATNFAWIKDRFGMSWQVNQPLGQPEPTARAEAPVWG
ncbi:VOC family protein [Nesterenkonia sp. LB17]|uniref:VOC family protein n=1 Tax=unclassified Nesterenkonia TaxID=2629769 RepID=UPI001F4D00D8|nr:MULTISPECIES: VOC family protein [unclassified Nesterenkonia]MCH8565717.1 VOC family protein [Nesterenkonia sp. LB17]MCH8570509.1 VOC family protein [Nesterenkonia sp. AY15]